ncbi:hypothetical protein JWJ90_13660, partial [Desulfobulbus rhabdoformis]|uniref:hypothetical protein n=1 Tax=Desulfobulbus rhabdoformis TaxID=34032 RepID=UPI001966CC99
EMILPSLMTYPFLLEVSFGELFPTGYVIFLLESPQTPLSSITLSIANAIKSLTEKIDFHNFTIGQTVHGFTAAEFRGRQQYAEKKPLMQ